MNEATVRTTGGTVDPNPSNDSASTHYTVYGPLGSQINGFDPVPPGSFSGEAENLDRAQIDYRVSGPEAPAPSPALGKLAFVDIAVLSLRTAPGSPQTCRWLANSRAQFRSTRASKGLCSKAIWLRATGTRHWKYALTKSLPAGRYIAYARAGDKAGAVQNVFSRKRKNRLDFTVR